MGDSDLTIPVVAFVGRSGSGKTTLLERLIPELAVRGVRVAVVKHAVRHAVKMDVRGTDTYRMWDAGAVHVALVAPDRLALTQRWEREPRLEEVLAKLGDGVDLIVLEGYKQSRYPKVEVVRQACDPKPIPGLEGRVAIVTDVPTLQTGELQIAASATSGDVFCFDDLEALADFLIARFVRPR